MKSEYDAKRNVLVRVKRIPYGGIEPPIYMKDGDVEYPCDPCCTSAGWTDGQVLEEGRDYELRNISESHNYDSFAAFSINPSLPTEDQDQLWVGIVNWIYGVVDHTGLGGTRNIIAKLKEMYTITRNK